MPDSGTGINGVAVAAPLRQRADNGGNIGMNVVDGPSHDGFHHRFRWAWRVVWRGKMIILVCLVALLAPTIFFLEQASPLYSAEVRIMVEAPNVSDVLVDRYIQSWLSENVIVTEAELIRSSVVARRVVDKLRLAEDPEFNLALRERSPWEIFIHSFKPLSWLIKKADQITGHLDVSEIDPLTRERLDQANVVREFHRKLLVEVERHSYVIVVHYTAKTREKAVLIANTVADTYVLDRLEAGFEDARRVSTWLGERLEGLRLDVHTAETAAEDYRALHGLRRKDERQATLTDQQLSELNSRLVVARSEMAQKQARLDQVRQLQQSQGTMESASYVLQSPLIQRLREQEATVQRAISDAQKTYGDRHPRLVGLRAELGEIRGTISSEIDKIARSVANDLQVAAAGVRSLEEELAGTQMRANLAGEAEIKLRELERQAEASRTLYEAFLSRFKREAQQERMQRANARVVSPAELPIMPSYPRKPQILAVVTLMATIIGVVLVFLLDRLDNVIRSGDEAEEMTGLPVLGMIPVQSDQRERPFEQIQQSPRSALADAVRTLRTSITIGDAGNAPIIMVTSSVPKEGKTFVSLCLSVMFAKSDPRVLLIDADLHRPRQHALIGTDGDRGLAQILTGEATFEEVVQRGAIETLDFLPAGKCANVSELIQQPALEVLMRDLVTRYDRIVIDTAPVLAVTDTRVLARFADRVVYLVRWNLTPRDAVRNGLKILRGAGVNVFGVALSQVNRRKHNRYGYRDYGHYYGRYREYYNE